MSNSSSHDSWWLDNQFKPVHDIHAAEISISLFLGWCSVVPQCPKSFEIRMCPTLSHSVLCETVAFQVALCLPKILYFTSNLWLSFEDEGWLCSWSTSKYHHLSGTTHAAQTDLGVLRVQPYKFIRTNWDCELNSMLETLNSTSVMAWSPWWPLSTSSDKVCIKSLFFSSLAPQWVKTSWYHGRNNTIINPKSACEKS